MLFNPPAHPVHQAALKLKNDFDALYQRRLEATLIEEEKRKRAADEEARHAQGGGSSSSSAAAQRSSAALKAGSKAAEVGAKRKSTHQQRGGDDSDEGDSSDSDEHGPSAAKKARKSTGGSAAGGGAGKDVSKSGTGSSGSGGAGGASDEVRDLRNQIQQLQSSLVTIMECTKQLAATQAAGQVMAMAPAGGAGAAAALMNPAAFAQIMASAAGLGGGAGGSAPISEREFVWAAFCGCWNPRHSHLSFLSLELCSETKGEEGKANASEACGSESLSILLCAYRRVEAWWFTACFGRWCYGCHDPSFQRRADGIGERCGQP
jgi:hypothetical protein